MIDFCSNAITLSETERQFANTQLNTFMDQVRIVAKNSSVPLNIYTGGSLALKEPALEFNKGQLVGLHSDVDFFVVVAHKKDIEEATFLVRDTINLSPKIERTFHFVPIESTNSGSLSCSVDDLFVGLNEPILEQFELPLHPTPIYDPKSILELFVSKLGVYVLPYIKTSHLLTDGNSSNKEIPQAMAFLKLILHGLRMVYYGKIPGTHGLTDIAHLLPEGIFDNFLPRKQILEIITAREHYDAAKPIPELNLSLFTHNIFIYFLGLENNADSMSILENLADKHYTQNILLDSMPLAETAYVFMRLEKKANIKNKELTKRYLILLTQCDEKLPDNLSNQLQQVLNYLESKDPMTEDEEEKIDIFYAELHSHYLALFTHSITQAH